MRNPGYHFFQRTDRHREVLDEKKEEVETAIKNALKGVVRKAKIHIHPTHFHVFARLNEKKRLFFVSSIKREITKLEGIRWDAEYYLIPVSDISEDYVSRLLKDMHRNQMI